MRARLVLGVGMLAVACGDGGGARGGVVTRDSAGVRIVENADRGWAAEAAWTVEPTPIVDIGSAEGDPASELDGVGGVARLSDGRIVVANGGSSEIRYYSADGALVSASGRNGEGPGEFRGFSGLRRQDGDTLVVYDGRLHRLTVLGPDGAYVRSVRLEGAGELAGGSLRGILPDGGVLMEKPFVFGAQTEPGVHGGDTAWGRFGADGVFIDTVGVFPTRQTFVFRDAGVTMAGGAPGALEPQAAVAGDGFWFGWPTAFVMDRYDANGRHIASVRLSREPAAITQDMVAGFRKSFEEDPGIQENRQLWQRYLDAIPFAERMPAFSDLVVDATGNVWVREYAFPPAKPSRWSVFDAAGVFLGDVAVDPGFLVREIGDDYLLGVWTDDLDVEHVRMYRLTKAAR